MFEQSLEKFVRELRHSVFDFADPSYDNTDRYNMKW